MATTTITSLAFQLREAFQSTSQALSLGHAQQLIVAALGYSSLASYQASTEAKIPLENIAHLAPDWNQLEARCKSLGVSPMRAAPRVFAVLKDELPWVVVHKYEWGINEAVFRELDDVVVNDGRVSGEMAMSNGDGIDEVYLEYGEFDFSALPLPGELHVESFPGHVAMGIDEDRPYFGHKVDVEVQLSFLRTGKRSIGSLDIEVENARLLWPGDDESDDDQVPYLSPEVALSEYLDISVDEAELLVGVELDEVSSEDGLIYEYLMDASQADISDELARRLTARFGSLQISIPSDIYDRIRPQF